MYRGERSFNYRVNIIFDITSVIKAIVSTKNRWQDLMRSCEKIYDKYFFLLCTDVE